MYQSQPQPPNTVNRIPDLVSMEVACVRIAISVLVRHLESLEADKEFYQDKCTYLRDEKRYLARAKDDATDYGIIFRLGNQLEAIEKDLRHSESRLYRMEQEISILEEKVNAGQTLDEFEISLTLRFRTYSYLLQTGKQIDMQLIKGQFYIDLDGATMPLSRIRGEKYLENDKFFIDQSGADEHPTWKFQAKNKCDSLNGRLEKQILGDIVKIENNEKTNLRFGFRLPDYLTSIKILNANIFTTKTDKNSVRGTENELKHFFEDFFESDLSYTQRSI
jgi:hypothetical protein